MDKKDIIYETQESKILMVKEAATKYEVERLYTYEDYITWPDDERWELIDGIPFRLEAPSEYHQQILINISFAIRGYLTGKSCKVYAAPFDVRLDINGLKDTVVQPDILVICDKTIIDQKGAKGAPDLVIEILSKSTAKKDRTLKLAKYEKHGVKEFWIVDPVKREVYVYILNEDKKYNQPVIYRNSDDILHATILSNFKISLENIFTRENVVNNELFEQGVEQGKIEGKIETAKKLLNKGMTIDDIKDITDLTTDVIDNLSVN